MSNSDHTNNSSGQVNQTAQDHYDHHQNDQASREITSSPGSHSNSSSSRQQRVVELLQENYDNNNNNSNSNNNDDRWQIRPEFYDEDVAQNSDNMSDEDEDDVDIDVDDELDNELDDVSQQYDYDSDDYYGLNPDNNDERRFRGALDGVGEIMGFGFIVEPAEVDIVSSDSEIESEPSEQTNYDTTLPARHDYLQQLEESRGFDMFVEGSTVNLLLFNIEKVVLLPGQLLPITTVNLNPRLEMYLRNSINGGVTTVGLMSAPHKNSIGTTAEITRYKKPEGGEDEVRLLLQGRQRFQLVSPPFESAVKGEIRILPEILLGRPYPRISSLTRFFTNHETPSKFIISKHPYWLLRRYEARYLMLKILNQIEGWCQADLTKDPNDFSYWVAANLPISNSARMKALSFSCTEERLMWLLEILEHKRFLGCSGCKNLICKRDALFRMSVLGPQCSFVNPSGHVHDTLTIRKADGLVFSHRWSREFSWFPGYEWRMVNCNVCSRHMGWIYKSIDKLVKPRKFFGLTRSSIRLQEGEVQQFHPHSDNEDSFDQLIEL